MPDGSRRTERISQLVTAWAGLDPDAALAWTREHAAEPGVASASAAHHGALLGSLARDDPQAALAEWRALSDPETRQTAVSAIAAGWGKTDPAAALRWAAEHRAPQPAAPRFWTDHNDLLYAWSKKEPEAALRWVEDLHAAEHEISYRLRAFDGTWDDRAPRVALADLYAKIRDPQLRLQTLRRHVADWLTNDPAAARAWVEASPALTPADRAVVLESGGNDLTRKP